MAQRHYLFLIGAPKAGTTSLAGAFASHPEVAVARGKEPRYFTDFADRPWCGPKAAGFVSGMATDWASYEAQFEDGRWRLDASTDYLSCPSSPDRLAAFAERYPVKVVAVLRDPVARVLSEYQHTLRDGYQTCSLAESLAAEDQRIADGWHPLFHHIRRSRYAAPLPRYRRLFGRDFHVLDFHDPDGPIAVAQQLAGIMGVAAPSVLPHSNAGYAPRSATVAKLMQAGPVRSLAQRVLPARFRSRLRQGAERLNATTLQATLADLETLRTALADDIAWCQQDAQVPTAQWRLALGPPGQRPSRLASLRP